MPFVRVAPGGDGFILAQPDGEGWKSVGRFVPWGVNYDHARGGTLLEDYWEEHWRDVVEDFGEIKALNANVVRIHLQVARFMDGPDRPNAKALAMLKKLVKLAEDKKLYLDVTGLGCYHKKDVPAWYDKLSEADRWAAQAVFWEAVARTCADSPAVFCYDLMNEPIIGGPRRSDKNGERTRETDWLAGSFGGKHFVQRINLERRGRSPHAIAKAWIKTLTDAIRKHDKRHMITVGVIPWALTFPKAKPLFHDKDVSKPLDFVAVHFYPRKGKVDEAIKALEVYDIGKPIVIEETFPLKCSEEELIDFFHRSRKHAHGWISFYWGTTAKELQAKENPTIGEAITRRWLIRFKQEAATMTKPVIPD